MSVSVGLRGAREDDAKPAIPASAAEGRLPKPYSNLLVTRSMCIVGTYVGTGVSTHRLIDQSKAARSVQYCTVHSAPQRPGKVQITTSAFFDLTFAIGIVHD